MPTDADMVAHWRNLGDTLGIARAFSELGIGCGQEAERVMLEASAALGAILLRRNASVDAGSGPVWTATTEEHEALCWLVHLHFEVQCRACSLAEFERAYNRARERQRQALAGNVPPGTVCLDATPV